MFLEDLDVNSDFRFSRLNSFLQQQYGMTLSEDSSIDELYQLEEDIQCDNELLRFDKTRLHEDPAYSRNLVMLEGVRLLIQEKEEEDDPQLTTILNTLAQFVGESWSQGYAVSVDDVVGVYGDSNLGIYDENLIRDVMYGFVSSLDESYSGADAESSPYDRLNHPSDDLRKEAEIAYKKMYGDEPLDYQPSPRAKKALDKNRPSMLSKLKKFVGK